MLLLTIDTSGKHGSVGLARLQEGKAEVELIEAVPLAGGTFSAQLVPQIASLLAKHSYTKSDLAAFVVISGPGSFTGLRVGLAAVKALAEVLQKPIAAVSLLEAVASSSPVRGRVLSVVDAGRGEVYAGEYELAQFPRMLNERLLTWEEFLAQAKASGEPVVTPDAALSETVRAAGVACELVAYPASELIARIGWQHIHRGQTVRPDELEANYIRRSDAEIFSHPRQ